jgi:hypothetical protein
MRRVFTCIADYYNSNGYSLNLTACHRRYGKTIAITGTRDPVKIVVHQRWHTLQKFNPWRVKPISGMLLK